MYIRASWVLTMGLQNVAPFYENAQNPLEKREMVEMGAYYVRYRTERLGVEGDHCPGCKEVFYVSFP
jgi:hypothetical protein